MIAISFHLHLIQQGDEERIVGVSRSHGEGNISDRVFLAYQPLLSGKNAIEDAKHTEDFFPVPLGSFWNALLWWGDDGVPPALAEIRTGAW